MAQLWLLRQQLLLSAASPVFAQMTVSVQPGGSIQAALDKVHAAGGGTVQLEEVRAYTHSVALPASLYMIRVFVAA